MSRIATTLAALKAQGRKALIPYVTAGDPFADATPQVMLALAEGGALGIDARRRLLLRVATLLTRATSLSVSRVQKYSIPRLPSKVASHPLTIPIGDQKVLPVPVPARTANHPNP